MLKIGITGGIGSGKSVVAEIFRLHHIPVFDADTQAKNLNDTSPNIRAKLTEAFGAEIYKNNKLDRKKLAQLIFNNQENLRRANSIIHPELANHFSQWAQTQSGYPMVAIDAAVLFEAGFHAYVHKTITVLSPLETRIRRIAARDNLSREQIESRIHSQMSDEEKVKLSDFVIVNDNKHSLLRQVAEIIETVHVEFS
ncbi:MAG: dephospho-CoA kinase, partial [Bacteroidia bacterium]|nr:dephospho-CoA kinase [Bacteroidia bacterium]